MRGNRNWALDIPQYDVRAFQKLGRTMALYDSWGSDSSDSDSSDSDSTSDTYAPSESAVRSAIDSANNWSPALERNDGSYVFPSNEAGTSGDNWQIRDGRFYGNLQEGASALGLKPSELSAGLPSWLSSVSPGLAAILNGIGRMQDNGLPGYAMTPEERAAAADRVGMGGGGGAASGSGAGSGASASSDPFFAYLDSLGIGTSGTGGAGDGAGTAGALTYQADPSGLLKTAKDASTTYNSNFNTNYAALKGEVDRYNDPAYIASQRGKAMADVQRQADAGYQTSAREMARRGVNPGSGAFAALSNQRGLQTALGKVQAAESSGTALKDLYAKGLSGLSTMNDSFAKNNVAFGQMGLDASKAQNTFNLANADLGLRTNGGPMDYARLAMQKYGIDKGVQVQQDANNPWTTIGGMLFSKAIFG